MGNASRYWSSNILGKMVSRAKHKKRKKLLFRMKKILTKKIKNRYSLDPKWSSFLVNFCNPVIKWSNLFLYVRIISSKASICRAILSSRLLSSYFACFNLVSIHTVGYTLVYQIIWIGWLKILKLAYYLESLTQNIPCFPQTLI